jgi:catechol 2,3-dioxygenase-like lactoylglutathione lyase family enzyme
MVDMPKRRIDPRVEIGSVRLRVGNLDSMLAFYGGILGFEITHLAGQSTAILSAAGSHPHLVLTPSDETSPLARPPRSFAIRYPDRNALAEAYRALLHTGTVIQQALDEGVREALHVRDPDGNLVELYYDRGREQWPLEQNGTPRMESGPLDLDSLRVAGLQQPGSEAEPVEDSKSVFPLSATSRTRLTDVRLRLLNLHKVLLDDAKTAYEMDRGRVGSSASLLQLVINDPWFAWLHPLSELVVRIDETLQPDAPATEADGLMLLEQVERLLSPAEATEDFAQRYYEALQRQPAVIVAHAEVRRILKQAK